MPQVKQHRRPGFQTKRAEAQGDDVTCQGSLGVEAGPRLPPWSPSSKSGASGELCSLPVGTSAASRRAPGPQEGAASGAMS